MKKKTIKVIAVALLTVIALSGCATQVENETATEKTIEAAIEESNEESSVNVSNTDTTKDNTSETDSSVEQVALSDYDAADLMSGEALSEEELNDLQAFMNKAENYGYTVLQYKTPKDIDNEELSKYETYSKEEITCIKGVKKDNLVQVVIEFVDSTKYNRRITLLATNDLDNPYQFYSNRQLWEEKADKIIEATDYDTNEKITCGVITDYGEWGPEIDEIEDNAVKNYIVLEPPIGDTLQCKEVKEIAFCDINSDGIKDMIVILVYGDETIAVLCGGGQDKNGDFVYYEWKYGFTSWLSSNVSEITADNVISYIKDHQDEMKKI
ncbi:hypothetical protein D6853_10280 [Butyrivibrio sp. X503]|uniref:hypothetical protein n=1 Tax=Butyrivibrio sp. X503 TaxID=2364878 RepID=UPI000EA94417|nr:hypothetical protein [Butyrivibrio sp. X503]RKM55116.1 hypothetical protein D6853_10280 [Butyrivibrio sp. X503]